MLSEKRRFKSTQTTHTQRLHRSADQHAIRSGVRILDRGQREMVIASPGRLASAAAVWMSGTFVVCYLMMPLALAGLGLSTQTVASVVVVAFSAALALASLWMFSLVGLVVHKPVVSLEDDHRDRALVATVGGLLVWTILHNVLPGLVPFGNMGPGHLLSFLGANILENALFGVMLASVVKSVRGAFTLGVLFQGALLLASYAVMMSI